MAKVFKVGDATCPRPADKEFVDQEAAIALARTMAVDDFYQPIAVWEMTVCDIVHLFMCGQRFSSVRDD